MDWDGIAGMVPAQYEEDAEREVAAFVNGRTVERDPWQIASLGQADWCMRMVAEARAQLQAYDDEVALWREARSRIEQAGSWYEDRLKEWAVGQRTDQRKSFATAHGTVTTRWQKPAVQVDDEAAAVEWAKGAAPEAVKLVETVRLTDIKTVVRIESLIIGFEAIDKATGERETATLPCPQVLDQAAVAAIVDSLPGHVVEPIVSGLTVVDAAGVQVPGMSVRAGRITATVGEVLT